jgi:hypothetical protein
MTYNELKQMENEGRVSYHHSASERGYIGTKQGERVIPYTGRFGTGYKVLHPNKGGLINGKRSTQYYRIEYYIINQ